MHLRRPVGLVALAAMSASLLALAAPPAVASVDPEGTVFLNELHYDNASTDVGETVEIAGPVGTDLTGWSVVLYNGNPSTAATTYGTARTLTGLVPASGVVTLDYPSNGLQNGEPDGLALVDAGGEVQQLLSYEGVLTASNGPAAGQVSTDIGVREAGNEPIGLSLQLTGTGSTYGDFTWTGPVAATPGALNAGQVLQPVDPDAPALPVATCEPELVTPQGTGATSALSAVDADSLVTSITLSSPPVDGISVADVVPSAGSGAVATGDLVVSDQVAPGDYSVVVEFTTDSGQTATCTVDVAVTPSTVTPISTVQGSGATSPLIGQEVLVEGVVVGDYQERGEFGGFYVQSLSPDADPLTSEGLRVFSFATAVEVGDLVRVVGTVAEYESDGLYSGSETQLSPVRSIEVIGAAAVPAPTAVTLPFAQPVDGVDGQERYEGMLATLTNTDLVATDLYTLGRFGEVSLTTGEVLYIPMSAEQAAANDVDRITLDDGRSGQNLTTLPYTVGGDGVTLPRAGDLVVDPVTGVLTFAFGEWRIVPAVGTQIDFVRSEPRPEAPDEVGGDVQIASFNVLNYFVDFGGANRGANNGAELQRQQDKLVAAITGLDADVVGLIEIANDDGDALDTLVAALNAAQPDSADHYTAVEAPALNEPTVLGGTYGTDAIRQAIIYRTAVVTPVGAALSDPALLNPADPLFPEEPVFDRPPAVQTFVPVGGDREVTVVVNHFKSKGSSNDQCGTPDPFGGNCDDLRERQAAALVDLVEALGVEDVALLGDFNSYESEEPIQVLERAGYVSVVADQPREERTSYSFDGEFGSLDYIFLSRSLAKVQTGADIWQINSPEAVALDYNDYNQPALYAPGPYASSDHDPVLVGLDLVPDRVVGPVRPGRPSQPGRPAEPGRPDGAGRPAEPGPPPFAGTPARRGMTER